LASTNTSSLGWLAGLGAFFWWGLAPIYFKWVAEVPATEILAHRIAWCVPVTLLLMWLIRKPIALAPIIGQRKKFFGLMLATALVSVNWFVFTWAVTHDHILDTSLGYFINPIMSILLGVLILGESLKATQWLAVVLATMGVLIQIFAFGEFPWIALTLATTFALYGLIKKQIAVDSVNGFLLETSLALPVATGYILWTLQSGEAKFLQQSLSLDLLLMLGGVVTAVPLILFAFAARSVPLNGLGFMQFLAPSITFLLATQVYDEPLSQGKLISFLFIWAGLLLYLYHPLRSFIASRRISA